VLRELEQTLESPKQAPSMLRVAQGVLTFRDYNGINEKES